jgi:hypothetical protein
VRGVLSANIKRTQKFHFDVVVRRLILYFLQQDQSSQQNESF